MWFSPVDWMPVDPATLDPRFPHAVADAGLREFHDHIGCTAQQADTQHGVL
jgi:hypothetical protein